MPELATRMNWCAPRRAGVSLVALWAWTGWTTGSFPWRCSDGRPSFAGSVTRAGQLLPPDDEFLPAGHALQVVGHHLLSGRHVRGPALQFDGQALAGAGQATPAQGQLDVTVVLLSGDGKPVAPAPAQRAEAPTSELQSR